MCAAQGVFSTPCSAYSFLDQWFSGMRLLFSLEILPVPASRACCGLLALLGSNADETGRRDFTPLLKHFFRPVAHQPGRVIRVRCCQINIQARIAFRI